jgi:hypothetical protein
MREYQVRICERLGVQLPGPTRRKLLFRPKPLNETSIGPMAHRERIFRSALAQRRAEVGRAVQSAILLTIDASR